MGDGADFPRFSEAEFARRHAAARGILEEAGAAAVLLFGNRASHNEIQYLTNHAVAFEGALLFTAEGEMVMWVHYANHLETARRVSIVEDVQPALTRQRLVKSEEEIAWARRGAELSDLAIEALAREARPGLSEDELAAIVQGAYYAAGGRTHIHYLGTTSMHAPSLCAPAQLQSSRRLAAGDVILTELSAMHHGYWGQVLRCFAVGAEPPAEYARMHQVAITVFEEITGRLCDGTTSEELLGVAESIHDAGFTIYDDLVHMAVGGVYAPYLRTRRTTHGTPPAITYRENMLVVVQPNIVTDDLSRGVQVGEMVRVTKTGIERMHRVPMEFFYCG